VLGRTTVDYAWRVLERELRKDMQTVTSEGGPVAPLIYGVLVRPQPTQTDGRGTLCEILDLRWGLTDDPIVSVYQFTIRPGEGQGLACPPPPRRSHLHQPG
jgi:hypothetical protein